MPNTIAQNLQRLVNAKSAISEAITAKGGTVSTGDGFEDFPADIGTIPEPIGDALISTKPQLISHGVRFTSTWTAKTWNGLPEYFNGGYVWTDGADIYCSGQNGDGNTFHYVLDKATSTWAAKTWNGLTASTTFIGNLVWTDGTDIYHSYYKPGYSYSESHYVLDKATSTWTTKTWNGYTTFTGRNIWTDGANIYLSYSTAQYVLDKATSTWTAKTWNGLTNFYGEYIWTDGTDIYYSAGSAQYVLDKATSTWTTKTWNGVYIYIRGDYVWTDGIDIYGAHINNSGVLYNVVLDKSASAWTAKSWSGLTDRFNSSGIWTDGTDIYYSAQYVLEKIPPDTITIPTTKCLPTITS